MNYLQKSPRNLKKTGDDDEYEDEDLGDVYVPLRERIGRNKKTVSYNFDSDD